MTMIRLSFARASLWTLLLTFPLRSLAWLAPMARFWQQTAAAMAFTAMLLESPTQQQLPMLGKELQSTLQAPTEDRPRIQIPSNLPSSGVETKAPIVEALLYLESNQVRPDPLDTIVITVYDTRALADKVVAGAKIPVSRARFPVQIRLFSQNIMDQQGWSNAQDVIVRAVVCPADSASIPCSDNEAIMQAEGVAKLVRNLPGLPEGVTVRAAASLPLKGK